MYLVMTSQGLEYVYIQSHSQTISISGLGMRLPISQTLRQPLTHTEGWDQGYIASCTDDSVTHL